MVTFVAQLSLAVSSLTYYITTCMLSFLFLSLLFLSQTFQSYLKHCGHATLTPFHFASDHHPHPTPLTPPPPLFAPLDKVPWTIPLLQNDIYTTVLQLHRFSVLLINLQGKFHVLNHYYLRKFRGGV